MIRVLLPAALLPAVMAGAHAEAPLTLVLKDHRWQPDKLAVPAGRKVTLAVRNEDPTADEFESSKLGREKLIPPGLTMKVVIGPLEPGDYPFKADFHGDTGQGVITAK